jgi:four helix bundle protein
VRDYRNLKVWEKAHRLTLAVYCGTAHFPKAELFGLTSQIRRASVSVEANLAEGCGRRSDGEMARFVQIAMGSGSELSCHLLLARDLGMLEDPEYRVPQESATEVLLMLSALSERVKRPAAREHLELTAKG